MQETWEQFDELRESRIAILLFGHDPGETQKKLVLAWLVRNGLGPGDVQQWFADGGSK